MAFSGLTLEQLEEAFTRCESDVAQLTQLHDELVDRKRRRESAGKPEKPRAVHLRQRAFNALRTPKHSTVGVAQSESSTNRVNAAARVLQNKAAPQTFHRPANANAASRPLGFAPTDEQLAAVEAFRYGDNLKINAFAGSGKTSTLALLSRHSRGAGIYIAFNRACVKDASARFSDNVKCSTVHALAFRSLNRQFRMEKLTGKLNPNIVLSHFNLERFESGGLRLSEKQMASLALATFREFAYSRHDSPRQATVPLYGIVAHTDDNLRRELGEVVRGIVEAMWEKMRSPASNMPLGHDGYLKYWALTHPKLNVDFILLDEAQDTNDVVLDMLERQTCQIVYVGDRHQQIYEWRGAVNALDRAQASRETMLTRSFRFGDPIAVLANAALRRLGEPSRIVGNVNVSSRIEGVPRPDAIVARSNGSDLAAVIACLENGDIPFVEGGTDELKRLIRGVYELRENGYSTAPEFFGFSSWDEIVEYSETDYGKDLATFVRLVQTYGLGRLWHIVKNVAEDPETAALTISTTHKAKGREWGAVRLEDDFVNTENDQNSNPKQMSKEEIRILYVAITRAKNTLQIGEQSRRFLGI